MVSQLAAQQKKADPIVGTYDWHNGEVVVIRADGSATSKAKKEEAAGRWVVNPYGGGGYVIMWEGGYIESLKLRKNSSQLAGKGLDSAGKVYTVTGTKR